MFLHYYGGSSRTWDRVVRQLPNRYRIVAPDHRGWGQSDAPADGYRIAELGADAEGVIAGLGLKRYILVGHSMGGKVAQWVASRQPLGLQGLVLIAPSPPTPMPLSDEQRAGLTGVYQTRESIEFVLDNVLTAKKLDAACREQVIEDSLNGAPQAKAAWPNVMMGEDISAAVASIDVPTIVISGSLDAVDSIDALKAELMPRIPHASMHVLDGVGHLSPLEAPEEVARVLANFAAAIETNSEKTS